MDIDQTTKEEILQLPRSCSHKTTLPCKYGMHNDVWGMYLGFSGCGDCEDR